MAGNHENSRSQGSDVANQLFRFLVREFQGFAARELDCVAILGAGSGVGLPNRDKGVRLEIKIGCHIRRPAKTN
jgi:hypothetical protein